MVDTSNSAGTALVARARQNLLAYARSLADAGAHYLWGGNGEKPRVGGPIGFAHPILSHTTPGDSTFCAAISYVPVPGLGMQKFVCAGRCFAFMPGGAYAAIIHVGPSNPALDAFITRYQNKWDAQYNWGPEPTPRKIQGKGQGQPTDFNNNSLDGTLVWGEGCDDTQHFDCYGFVNLVLQKTCGLDVPRGTNLATLKTATGEAATTTPSTNDAVLPADIFVYDDHIAFATGDPPHWAYDQKHNQYLAYPVAQAEMAVQGVTYGHGLALPGKRLRLTEAALLVGTHRA